MKLSQKRLNGIIPKNVTVICLGNMCRSPAGEYLIRFYANKSKNPKIKQIQVDSAGLDGGFMHLHKYSKKYLEEKGIDPSHFKSKGLSREYLERFDSIIVMEDYLRGDIIREYYEFGSQDALQNISKRIKTMKEAAGSSGDVVDPYGMPKSDYFEIMREIDTLSKKIVNSWES